MDEFTGLGKVWYIKRLSGNDTLANGSHQAGPYVPKDVLFKIFPSLNNPEINNPDKYFNLCIDSHADARQVRVVRYNNRYEGGTRDEARMTNFGGGQSALLDPESTGAIAVFIFCLDTTGGCEECRVWVCSHETEEDLLEQRVRAVEPGKWKLWSIDERDSLFRESRTAKSCWLEPNEIPVRWMNQFPTGEEIVTKTMQLRPSHGLEVDKLLLARRDCEFELFRSVEEAVHLPTVQQGFSSMDDFLLKAQSILQSRKCRSGHSLELHTRAIFIGENLQEGTDFAWQPESELGKKPDFFVSVGECVSGRGLSR